MKYTLIVLAAIALLFNSCSIEKRKYQDGYHVEWHHKKKRTEEVKEIVATDNEEAALAENSKEQLKESEVVVVEEMVIPSKQTVVAENVSADTGNELSYVPQEKWGAKSDTITPGNDYYTSGENGTEINEKAEKSKLCGLLGVGSLLLGIFGNLLSSTFSLGPFAIVVGGLFTAALVFSILAVVFGDMAKKEIKALKGKYANEQDATLGSIVGWVVIGLYIAAVVIAILAILLLILLFAA